MTVKYAQTSDNINVGPGKYMDSYVSIEGNTIYTKTHIYTHVKLNGFTGGMKAYFSDINGNVIYETNLFQYGVDGEYIPFSSHDRVIEERIVLPSNEIYEKTDRITIWIGRASKNRFFIDVIKVISFIIDIRILYEKIKEKLNIDIEFPTEPAGEYITTDDGVIAHKSCLLSMPQPIREPGPGQVALFQHIDYGGECRILNMGAYCNPAQMGFPNDTLSSIKVGSQVKVVLFEHINFGGRSQSVSGSISSLVGSEIGNDTVSSIIVGPKY